jgi:hypothetical protein
VERQNLGLGLLVILVLGGVIPLLPASAKLNGGAVRPTAKATASELQTPSQVPLVPLPAISPDLRTILRRYLDDRGPKSLAKLDSLDPRHRIEVESLIAIVPDPIESRFGDVFDTLLESLQSAAEAAGFVLGPFDLAWNRKPAATEIKTKENCAPAAEDKIYERQPGIMLFRDPYRSGLISGESHLLVMFLVGETPRSGVELAALTLALDQAASLPQILNELLSPRGGSAKVSSPPPEIRIMGPTFSGSASSLEFGLRDWSGTRKQQHMPVARITIISGSADAIDKTHFLSGLDASFHATMVPIQSARAALLKWLGLSAKDEVAILSEGDTVYGQLLSSRLPANPASSPLPAEGNHQPAMPKVLRFAFPLHIADLERAAKESEQNAADSSNPGLSLGHRDLPLAAEQSGAAGDVIPLFSSAQTNAMEVALWELLETIHERRIPYSIIGATDVHDIDYIAKQLQNCCAESRIVTLNSDLLFLHSEVNPDLAGAIVASTYPLISQNQRWTGAIGSSQTYQFSSGMAQGVFNATVALLGKPERMVEYGMPFYPDSQKPGLWLTVVGRGDVWPVEVLRIDDSDGYLYPKLIGGSTSAAVSVPLAFEFFFVAASAVCSIVWLMMIAMLFPALDATDGVLARLRRHLPTSTQIYFGESVFRTNRRQRRVYLFILAAGLIITYAILSWYYYLSLFRGWPSSGGFWVPLRFGSIMVFGLITVGCGSIASVGALWLVRQPPNRGTVPYRIRIYGSIVAVMIVVGEFVSTRRTDSIKAAFLFLRAATLGDGVSPLVPLLWVATAGLLMLICVLRRLNLGELRNVKAVFLSFGTGSFKGIEQLETKIRNELSAPLPRTVYLAPISFVVGAMYCYAHWGIIPASLDGGAFAVLFLILGFVVYWVIAVVLIRLVITWLAIRGLLRHLYWHPSRSFYAILHQGLPDGENTVTDMLSADPSITALEVSLEQARLLARYAPAAPALPVRRASTVESRLASNTHLIARLTSRAEKSLENASEADAQGTWREAARFRGIAERLVARLSRKVAEIFEPTWSLDEQEPWNDAGAPGPSVMTAGGSYIAARVADFLRQVLPQVSLFAFSATAGVILMLFAVSSYPFPAQGRLVLFNWVFVLFTVGTCAFVYFSMNRDRVLSLLSGTSPGKVSWNTTFVLQILTHGVLPILAVLGAAFPAKFGLLAQWIGSLFGGHT